MFDIVKENLLIFIDFIPYLIGLRLVFAFIGDLLFGGR